MLVRTVIVIPCLNEARLITRTARSLGFGAGSAVDRNTTLVLVDNGSTDKTWATLVAIRGQAPPGSVILAREAERGYVPPRHRGTVVAAEIATRDNVPAAELLILQADADTVYEPGYVAAMQKAARTAGPNHILEGRTQWPARFARDHPGFQRLADAVDREMEGTALDSLDVVVDDKVAGYRLSDYRQWGGLRRDYMSIGAEVHAETTRLFIRAQRFEGRKFDVDEALALPSRRKIQRNPVRHFASAGFPREAAWWRTWNARYNGPNDLHAFDDPQQQGALAPAIAARRAHVLALFTTIPRVVANSRGVLVEGTITSREAASLRHLASDDLGQFFEVLLPGL